MKRNKEDKHELVVRRESTKMAPGAPPPITTEVTCPAATFNVVSPTDTCKLLSDAQTAIFSGCSSFPVPTASWRCWQVSRFVYICCVLEEA